MLITSVSVVGRLDARDLVGLLVLVGLHALDVAVVDVCVAVADLRQEAALERVLDVR